MTMADRVKKYSSVLSIMAWIYAIILILLFLSLWVFNIRISSKYGIEIIIYYSFCIPALIYLWHIKHKLLTTMIMLLLIFLSPNTVYFIPAFFVIVLFLRTECSCLSKVVTISLMFLASMFFILCILIPGEIYIVDTIYNDPGDKRIVVTFNNTISSYGTFYRREFFFDVFTFSKSLHIKNSIKENAYRIKWIDNNTVEINNERFYLW